MKNVVMGTAGHIDHGKTTLVRHLTGVDTDRLAEEKRRGMTIELGFAPLTLPSGNTISVIDVPGHEKFVKTMVAGITGIDFVMLVVAADEGVMPQTREHIDILTLLDIKAGVVALTKTDLVDDEWLELVKDEVRKALDGTPLAGIPIIPVSSVTGAGMEKLVEALEQLAANTSKAEGRELFRLPVDRVFIMTGYGTVVTGTVSGGKINKGDTVEILPSGLTSRVRGIQVHGRGCDSASAGDRCALNLSGIEKDEIKRGDVIAAQGIIRPTRIADAVLYTVRGKGGIIHNQRVHVHSGTKEALARVRVLGADVIPEGGKGYVQLKFEEPVAILRKDRFIIRTYSPVSTIGGGWIVFHDTKARQRFPEEEIAAFKIGEHGSLKDVAGYIIKSSKKLFSTNELWRELFEDRDDLDEVLGKETAKGGILRLEETDKYLDRDLFNEYVSKINLEFEQLYKRYPYRYRIDREELKSKVFYGLDSRDFTAVLNRMVEENLFAMDGNNIMQPGGIAADRIFAMKPVARVEKAFLEEGPTGGDINMADNEIEEIKKFLLQTGRIIDLGSGVLIHKENFNSYTEKVKNVLIEHGSATAGEIRDHLGIGRKMAIALLEYLDCMGITQRVGDTRKPGSEFQVI